MILLDLATAIALFFWACVMATGLLSGIRYAETGDGMVAMVFLGCIVMYRESIRAMVRVYWRFNYPLGRPRC